MRSAFGPLAIVFSVLCAAVPATAQSPARFSLDSAVSVDLFRGQNTVDRPNIILDVTAVARLGNGWLVYVRPWFRQPRTPEWEKEIYQAALQYSRPGPIATRLEIGYLASPVGLGMMDTRPGLNPTIAPHYSYILAMPAFDASGPRVQAIAASYPLGSQFTASTERWDARFAVVNTAPTRTYKINGSSNPPNAPVAVLGGGITPRVGLRIGGSIARGDYAAGSELTGIGRDARTLTMVTMEGEYAFGYTKISGEVTRDRFETSSGHAVAYAWFIQGTQTLTPRWFVAGRQEGVSAPRAGTAASPPLMQISEATVGYRLSADFTLRGSFLARKSFTRSPWDQQGGVSLVWAHRWW